MLLGSEGTLSAFEKRRVEEGGAEPEGEKEEDGTERGDF